MTSAATLPPLMIAGARPAPPSPPLVLIDGHVRAELAVTEVDAVGPTDERTVELVAIRSRPAVDPDTRAIHARLRGSPITIVQPITLTCGSSRLIPLFHGRITGLRERAAATTDDLALAAKDAWSEALGRPLDAAIDPTPDSLDALVAWLNAIAGLDLSTASLPSSLRLAPVPVGVERGQTLGGVLRAACDAAGVFVERRLAWSNHHVIERRSLRPIGKGRPIRLTLPELANPAGALTAIRAHIARTTPVKIEAKAAGQVVESTFTLIPGWGEGDEGLADTEYARSTAADFDAVAAVFRLWVLNEDGASASPPFDLTALFADGRPIDPRPLRFLGALTRDSGGRSVGVVVDTSDDAGETWSRFAGRVAVLTDRAGVYLDDDALPTSWLAAVRSGDARLRVTASLRSPLPLIATRWIGNPFAGEFRHETIRVGDAFAHRRVAPTSRFHADVTAGAREADVADDRAAMDGWLATRVRRGVAARGSASLDVIGSMPALRIGDRVERLAGRPVGLDTGDPRVERTRVTIHRITRRYDRYSTRLECDVR